MARSVYYQSASNPLQPKRLPARRPCLGLLEPWPPILALSSFLAIAGVGLVIVFFTIVAGASNWRPDSTFLPMMIGGTCLVLGLKSGNYTWILAMVATLVCLYPGWPPWFLIVCAASGLGLLTWQFARHWIGVSVTPHRKERRLRDWTAYMRFAAILPLLATALWWFLDDGFWPLGVLATLIILQFLRALLSSERRYLISALGMSLTYWFLEDHRGANHPEQNTASPIIRAILSVACLVMITQVQFVAIPQLSGTPAVIVASHGNLDATSAAHDTKEDELPTLSGIFARVVTVSAVFTVPLFIVMFVAIGLSLPVLLEAERERRSFRPSWLEIVDSIQHSPDPIVRQSIYRGRNAADQSPILVPRSTFEEPAHFLGDSGSGKTSLGLAPTMEQLLYQGDASLLVIDLKGDSLELLATLQVIAERVYRRTNKVLPVQQFSNQEDRSTFAFNPLDQPYWRNLSRITKSDILCGALGLHYGSDYGEGFYSSANAAVTNYVMEKNPGVRTFREMAECLRFLLATAPKHELDPEIRKAGIHVLEVFKRLGEFEALNIASPAQAGPEVVEHAIDLSVPFQKPSLMYFHLPAALSPGAAPEIARLVTYLLLAAATRQGRRKHRVYLVIDEFQRMVSRNLSYMLQLARSMGVSLILANQSLQDLKTAKADLIPAVEANCRYREWFSVSSSDDRRRLIESSGETIDFLTNNSTSSSEKGTTSSVSEQEMIAPRLTLNDVLLASDHPHRSIIRVSRGAGYAQFGGMPLIAENEFHITADEYERRKSIPWPEGQPGTFVPQSEGGDQGPGSGGGTPAPPPDVPKGPIISGEVIGRPKPTGKSDSQDAFTSYLAAKSEQQGAKE